MLVQDHLPSCLKLSCFQTYLGQTKAAGHVFNHSGTTSKVDTLHIQMMEENVKPQHLFQGNAE